MNISEKRWRWTAAAGRRTFLITSDNKANRNCPETEISIQFLSAADCLWECFASINVKSSATRQTQSQQKSALLILAPSEEILNNGWVCVAVCEGSAHKRDDALGRVFNAAENPFSRQWGGWFSFCELKQLAVKLPFVCFVWMRCSSLESRLSPSASKLFTDRKKAITALKKWLLWRCDEVRDREIKSFWTDWWILGQNAMFSWTKPWEQSGHLKTCQLKMEEHPHQLLSVRFGTGSDSDQTESQAQEPLTLDSAGPAGSPDCHLQHPDVIKALCKS